MAARRQRTLALAAASGRVGFVFFIGKDLKDWRISGKASSSAFEAAKQTRAWIRYLEPDVVICEALDKYSRKGEKTTQIIEAIAKVAADSPVLDIRVPKSRTNTNKYDQARGYAERFSELLMFLPKRPKLWEAEPRNMIYFEALSLVESATLRGETTPS